MYLRKLTVLLIFCLSALAAASQICIIPIQNNTISLAPATCAGSVATLKGSVPTGGTGTYTYQWQRTSGNCNSGNFQDITVEGNNIDYAVPTGTPTNVCFRRRVISGTCLINSSSSITVANNDRTNPNPPTVSVTQPTCNLNTGTITVTNPAPANGIKYSIDGVSYSNATGVFTGVSAGNYSVTVLYPAGCISPPASVTINAVFAPTGTISPINPSICAGNSVLLTVSSNNATSFQWVRNGTPIPGATQSTFNASLAGTYTVNLSNGVCTATTPGTTVTVNPVPTGSITASSTSICEGDTAILTATGGASYQWFRNNNQIGGATSAVYNATLPGIYTVDIINAQGCKARSSNDVTITLNPAPTGTLVPANAHICAGSFATLSVIGVASSYQWFLNGNPIPNATGNTYQATQAGAYRVRLTNNNCSSFTNTINVTAGSAIGFTLATTTADCLTPTGSIVVSGASGGVGSGYTYSINNGSTFQISNNFPGLSAGNYQVVVKDAAGCTSTPATASIQSFTSTLTASAVATPIPCNQTTSSALVNASGGTAPYTYSLNNATPQPGNSFSNLSAGTYNVLVRDAAGCNFSVNFTITPFVSTLAATHVVTDARCGAPAGAVAVQATGGTAPYRFTLDNSAPQTTGSFPIVGVGLHKVTVEDAAGCTFIVNFEVRRIGDVPNVLISNPPRICPGTTTSLQAAAVTAGSDAGLTFSYFRDTNATQLFPAPAAAPPGTYYIKGTNAAGCFAVKPVVVTPYVGTPGRITLSSAPTACIGFNIILTASQGTSYQWYRNDTLITGATLFTYAADRTGAYSVAINDGTCSIRSVDTVQLVFRDCSNLPDRNVFVPTAFTPNKNGQNDVLRPILNSISELRYFKVYNRWGQVVFETNTIGKGWDGTMKGTAQPSETYSWILECVGNNGQIIKRSGRSLLIR